MTHLPTQSSQTTALSISLSNTLLATTQKLLQGSGILEMTQSELLTWWQKLSDEWKFLILQQGLDAKLWGDDVSLQDFWFFDPLQDYKAVFDWDNSDLIMPFLSKLKAKKTISFDIDTLKTNHPLKQLCYLSGISLSLIHIDNPEVFVELNNLTSLSFLQRHQTIHVHFLKKAHYLQKLILDYGRIDNIEGLSYLINLKFLSLNHNAISHLYPLKFLDKLTYLSITHNKLCDISIISQLPNIQTLDLSFNSIVSLEALSYLNELTSLYLNNNNISDISVLSSLHNLKFLSLENNPIDLQQINVLQNALPDCLIFYDTSFFE